jgi:thiol:disulfide interchange protein
MKIFTLLTVAILTITVASNAQEKKDSIKKEAVHIYNPQEDAQATVNAAVAKANKAGKNVLVQVGGNWCIWCIRFHDLVKNTPELNSYIAANYEWVLVNYSPEQKNPAVLNKLGNPGRFGYPVFVVLDGKGNVLHIQDSGYLERDPEESIKDGKGHSVQKVMTFLKNWNFTATHATAK